MAIDETTGLLQWQPTAVGVTDVVVAVTDALGAGTTQTYQIAVAAAAPNLAPAIASRPSGFASVGSDYTYQVVGNDPNGDTLTYQLLQGPTGMTLDPDSGLLSWQPEAGATGSVTVVVGAVDPGGLGGAQRFTLEVVAANDAPVITSSPVTDTAIANPYRYDLQASDPNGDALTYELVNGPAGMTVDNFGRVRWTPDAAGSTAVEIAVRDVYGATTTQSFTLETGADDVAPEVAVFPSLFPADVGQNVSVFVSATDNVGVVSRTLTFDGNPVPLTNGAYRFTADQVGDFIAIATATDAAGNTTQSQTTVQVRDFTNTGVAPTVSLASLTGQVLTSPTEIVGTVTDDNLVNYTLGLASLGSDDFREIYRSTDTVSNGVLGQLDTALFQNDAYTLRLTAEDANGNIVFVDETVNIAGDLKLGNFTLSFTDMQLPVSGIPIAVTRTYDSLNANQTDDFGFGWRLEFRDTDLRTSLGSDEQFEQFGIRSQAFDDQTRVYLTLPGGQRQGFTFAPARDPISNNFPPIAGGDPTLYRPAFEADEGVTSTLSVKYDGRLFRGNDGGFGGLQGSPFNPADPLFGGVYVLTTQEGIEYEIDATSGDLLTAKDLNGNILTFEDSGIYSDSGTQVTFGRDAQGRMSALVSESGTRTEYEYDAIGRIIGSQTIQAGQPQATSSTFDANGNELTRTDALGRTTEFVYDALDQLIETIYPDGSRTQTSYDDAGNVIASTDALGRTTQFEYDALDRLTAVVDSNGQTTGYAYDEMGNLIEQTDTLGQITRFEYDGLGRMTATVRPLGERSETEYDAVGRITQTTDFNGEVITYAYNDLNQLTSKTLVNDGVTVDYSYSAGGRRESVTDARGTTLYDYDSQGRLLSRTEPDSTSVAYTYTQGGQVETITTPSGVTTYQYTDLNQLATVIDADGDTTTYRYDAVGNLTQTIRPNGTVQTYEYDDLNRLTYLESKDSSGTVIASYRYSYDAVGNKTSVEELGGRTVEYRYDTLYRLVEETITDPVEGNRTISYSFDVVGNRLSKDDSVDGLTTYTYDDNDRLLTETTNGVTTTYSYDDNGNLISEISPDKQTTYIWSAENRLMGAEITDANGTQVIEYAYDADGVRVAKTVDGDETRYLIDANRQYAQVLEEYDASTGTEVAYVHGNELISQSRDGVESVYLYDGHSGTRQLTDETGAVTDSYLYDAYGNVLKQVGDTENDYLYRGEQTDRETGLQYLRARYNDLETGRFISTDPFEGMADMPMSRHRYLYGYDNPLTYIDPSGMVNVSELSSVQLATTILAGLGGSLGGTQLLVGLNASKDGTIKWDGRGRSLSVGAPLGIFNSVAGAYVSAVSEPFAGKVTFGNWAIVSVGRSVAFDPFTFVSSDVISLFPRGTRYAANISVVSAPISITSPAVFGARPIVLGGGFLQAESNAIAPALPGLSFQAYTMGYGIVRSDQTLGLFNNPSDTFGYASPGISAEVGISIPLPSRPPRPAQRTPDV